MLHIVRERLLKIAKRHLDEAKIWNELCGECREKDNLYGMKFCNRKSDEHLRMVEYWHMACNNLHYKPGTWAYKF